MNENDVFKALADATRREFLDRLFQQDGQSLSELASHSALTRFGVAKHLGILEAAGLITTRKDGRHKRHYLNPVPIQQLYERWVSKFSQQGAQFMTTLKDTLERLSMSTSTHVFQIYIRTTPETLFNALTDGTLTAQYYFGSAVDADWQVGGHYRYPNPNGGTYVVGEVLEIDPPHRLVQSFAPQWLDDDSNAHVSRVTWEIEPVGEACKLRLTHENLPLELPGTQGIIEGWTLIISNLKSYLETGAALQTADDTQAGS